MFVAHYFLCSRMWFNTAFLKECNWKLSLKRDQLDKVCRKPKEYSPNFSVKICVEENKAHEPLLMNSWLHTKSTLFDVTSLLRTVPLLSTIEHVDVIACFLKEDVFQKDDAILIEGDSRHTFCLILSGEAELCSSEDGTETSRKMFKGHSAGDRSLVRKQSCSVDVIARGDVTCIRMVSPVNPQEHMQVSIFATSVLSFSFSLREHRTIRFFLHSSITVHCSLDQTRTCWACSRN